MKPLKHLNSQQKINRRYDAWSEFLQAYPFLLKHKAWVQNVFVDSLSRHHTLLATMQTKVIGFETVKELHKDDPDFQKFWNATDLQSSQDCDRHEGFLFKR